MERNLLQAAGSRRGHTSNPDVCTTNLGRYPCADHARAKATDNASSLVTERPLPFRLLNGCQELVGTERFDLSSERGSLTFDRVRFVAPFTCEDCRVGLDGDDHYS